jgi:hypothetical protein
MLRPDGTQLRPFYRRLKRFDHIAPGGNAIVTTATGSADSLGLLYIQTRSRYGESCRQLTFFAPADS